MKTKTSIYLGIFSALALSFSVLANPLIVPMAIGLQLITLMGVGAAIEMTNGLPEPSQAIGQTALSVTLNDGAGNNARVPLTSSAASAASIPPPAAPATTSTTATYTAGGYPYTSGPQSSASAACSVLTPIVAPTLCSVPSGATGEVINSGATCRISCPLPQGGYTDKAITETFACPSGYTSGSGTCNLSNARATDATKDYSRSGQSFSPYSGETASPMDNYLTASTVAVSNDKLSISGQSPSGEPRTINIQNTSDGGSVISASTQKSDGAGNTYVQNNSYTINGSGVITGATGSSVTGQLQNTGSGSYAYTGSGSAYTPSGNQESNGSTCGGAGQPKCAIDDSGFSGKDAGGAAAITALNEQAGLKDAKLAEVKDMSNPYAINWIPSLMPGPYAGCQPFTWDVVINHGPMAGFSSHHEFDLCPQFAFVRVIFGWLFYIMTVLYIVRTFFNSNKGA